MVYSLGLARALNRNTGSGLAMVVVAVGMVVALLAAGADRALATTYYANPGDSITTLINGMNPGDTLILNPGDYYSPVIITSKNGSPAAWFTIRGPDIGTARLIANSGTADMIEIRQSSYLRLENFEIDGNNMMYPGVDGINCKTGGGGTSYVHHLENPVRFEKEIKVTIEHGHGNHLCNEMSSVAYWYAAEPAAAVAVPSVEKRMPVLRANQGNWLYDEKNQITSRKIEPDKLTDEMKAMKARWREQHP